MYGELNENVYMKQPLGYNGGSQKVCKLVKSLYGLKQASRCWNKKFSAFIEEFDFVPCEADPCVFIRIKDDSYMILGIYVDDGLIAGTNKRDIKPVIDFLQTKFEMKCSTAECFLGMQLKRYDDGSIHLSQEAYARKILIRFGTESCNAVSTPSDANLTNDDFTDSEEAKHPYREAVGSLMHLSVAPRPDISFAVGVASRFMEAPKVAHVNAVKRIFKYIKGTLSHGIQYETNGTTVLTGYADYAGDKATRRSTSGFAFLLGNGIISWSSERQKSVALSTTESEYIAASHGIKELIWLKRLLLEMTGKNDQPEFYMDNQSAIRLIKNPEFHKRTDIRYHFILSYVPSDEQLADIMTKGLSKNKFENLCKLLNIVKS